MDIYEKVNMKPSWRVDDPEELEEFLTELSDAGYAFTSAESGNFITWQGMLTAYEFSECLHCGGPSAEVEHHQPVERCATCGEVYYEEVPAGSILSFRFNSSPMFQQMPYSDKRMALPPLRMRVHYIDHDAGLVYFDNESLDDEFTTPMREDDAKQYLAQNEHFWTYINMDGEDRVCLQFRTYRGNISPTSNAIHVFDLPRNDYTRLVWVWKNIRVAMGDDDNFPVRRFVTITQLKPPE